MVRTAEYNDLYDILSLYHQLFPEEEYGEVDMFSEIWEQIMNDEKIGFDGNSKKGFQLRFAD